MEREVTTTYLEMTSRSSLRPAQTKGVSLDVIRAEVPCPELNRFLYTAVGSSWCWHSRLSWSYRQWLDYLSRTDLETWVGYVHGTPAGYFELERRAVDVELAYFGLLPSFVGKGLGGALLTTAVERAWNMNAKRVWVHTSDLDHPAACKNYEARGFRAYRTEKKTEVLPDQALEPWPGAHQDAAQRGVAAAGASPRR
jgi:GNAT superfamily N-acetyltransferase